jgi:predicted transposase YbfD/YdcC
LLHPKKVGTLPIAGRDEQKQTNEIGMFTALLDAIEIKGKLITTDALLTQRKIARYIVTREGDYHFTAKGNQATLESDITLYFENRKQPDFTEVSPPDHGRIETRRIWCSTALNDYLDFPHVAQVFLIEREVLHKKNGRTSFEIAVGLTSQSPTRANPQQVLDANRGHWTIENRCHYVIDWNYDEDRSRIRKGFGPENVTRLRRFAVGILSLMAAGKSSISETMAKLNRNTRLVFDYLRMTKNSIPHATA